MRPGDRTGGSLEKGTGELGQGSGPGGPGSTEASCGEALSGVREGAAGGGEVETSRVGGQGPGPGRGAPQHGRGQEAGRAARRGSPGVPCRRGSGCERLGAGRKAARLSPGAKRLLKESVTGSPTSWPLRTFLGRRLLFCADQGQFSPAGVRCFEKTGGRKVHGRKRILIYCQTASGRWLRRQVALRRPGLGSHPDAASGPSGPGRLLPARRPAGAPSSRALAPRRCRLSSFPVCSSSFSGVTILFYWRRRWVF